MDYTTGIKKCKQALAKLTSNDSFIKRVDGAFNEISEIDPNETSVDHLKEIVEWCEAYLSVRDKALKNIKADGVLHRSDGVVPGSDGVSNENEKHKRLADLSQNLTSLCMEIIEYNSKRSDN